MLYWSHLQTTAGVSVFTTVTAAIVAVAANVFMNVALTNQKRKDNSVVAYLTSAVYAALTVPLPLLRIKGALRFRVTWKRYWPSVRRLPATHRERASERLDAYVSRKLKILVRYPCLTLFPALTAEAGDRAIGLCSALHSPGRRASHSTNAEPTFLHSDTALSCADVLRLSRGRGLPAPAQPRPAPVRGDVQTICTSRRRDRVAHGRRTPGRDRRALRCKGGLYVGGRDRPGGERGLCLAGLVVASCTEGGRRGRLRPKPKHMPLPRGPGHHPRRRTYMEQDLHNVYVQAVRTAR
jgi:hypothetical protein